MNLDAGFGIARREAVEELGEQAGTKPDYTERRILDAGGCEAGVLRERGYGFGLTVEDEAQEVRVMDRQIEDRARTGLGVAEAPAVQMFGQIAGVDDPSD